MIDKSCDTVYSKKFVNFSSKRRGLAVHLKV